MSFEAMRGKENSPALGHRRRRTLGNITNLSLSTSWASDSLGLGMLKGGTSSKTSNSLSEVAQLREEINSLRKVLQEKDATIQDKEADVKAQASEFVFQLRRHTQVNEELISYNSRLARDGGMLRDQLKLLQHEHSLMAVAYREKNTELQFKLAKSQEQVQDLTTVLRVLQQCESSQSGDQDSTKATASILNKGRSRSFGRRHSIGHHLGGEDLNRRAKRSLGTTKLDGNTKRSAVASSTVEPSGVSSGKAQQQQKQSVSKHRPQYQQDVEQWHTPNLYGDLLGLEPMPEDSREGSLLETASSGSQKSSDDRDETCTLGDTKSVSILSEAKVSTNILTSRNAEAEVQVSGSQPLSPAPPQKSSARRRSAPTTSGRIANSQRVQSATTTTTSNASIHFSRRAPAGGVSCCSTAANCSSGSGSCSVVVGASGRPSRRATEKVGSYLEPPLNTKMRRPD